MAETTNISWAYASANLWWGCVEVSPGCDHCYARRDAQRHGYQVWGADAPRRMIPTVFANLAKWQRKAEKEGVQRTVFTDSMCDICEIVHQAHPQRAEMDEARRRLFEETVPACPNLIFLALTKRAGNWSKVVPPAWLEGAWPSNFWPGISVVNQTEADRDIPKLLALKHAPVRWLSIEPQLGDVDITPWLWADCGSCDGYGEVCLDPEGDETCGTCLGSGKGELLEELDWVVAGGESGHGARASHPDWFRSLRDQCVAACVPFHFKQWGEWLPDDQTRADGINGLLYQAGQDVFGGHCAPYMEWANRNGLTGVGKKAAGRLLDGRTWDEFPECS